MIVFLILFYIVTGYYIFCTLYVLIFSVAGLFFREPAFAKESVYKKIAILVPAYKANGVIEELADNVLHQDYPNFDAIIIADSLNDDVMERLRTKPVKVMEFSHPNRTKALALNTVMAQLPDIYDIALILDADNLLDDPHYLSALNDAFASGCQAIQTHRTAKNSNTNLAALDAASEEINNTLFRRGHRVLGLSSSLIGSAMAFDYRLYKQEMQYVTSTGEDKELEMRLLKRRIPIVYLNRLKVLDEKTQQADAFMTQRARWIANQMMQARANFGEGWRQLMRGNFDFFDKMLQHFLMPRVLLLASTFIFSGAALLWLPPVYNRIWLAIFASVCFGMLLSVPRRMYSIHLFKSVLYLPVAAMLMVGSIFHIRGATRRFDATDHQSLSTSSVKK